MTYINPSLDNETLSLLADRYGEDFAQVISDQINKTDYDDRHLTDIEATQMAEIAYRLRLHVKERIREYRMLERWEFIAHNHWEHIRREMIERRKQIKRDLSNGDYGHDGLYRLYKEAWHGFLNAVDWNDKRHGLDDKDEYKKRITQMAHAKAAQTYKSEKASQMAMALVIHAQAQNAIANDDQTS
jgi:hypothetical protein